MSDITMTQARAAIDAAREQSADRGVAMNIAVVDAGANLKAFARMDGAWLGSIDISIKKARTARFFDMATGEIGKLSQPGGALYNIEHSNGGTDQLPGGRADQGRQRRDHRRHRRLRQHRRGRPRRGGRRGRGRFVIPGRGGR